MGVQKISKKQSGKKSSTLPKWSQIGAPGSHQSSTKFQLFRNFLHPGPEMGPESSRGPKKVAQGVQKVPKGFQKVAKSHEKAIHKAPTRRPSAMRKQQSKQATKQRRNEATKQRSNKATEQPSNQATKPRSNKATKQPPAFPPSILPPTKPRSIPPSPGKQAETNPRPAGLGLHFGTPPPCPGP